MPEAFEIDFSKSVPADNEFKPLFPNELDYREFRKRYIEKMEPELKEQSEARRKSEEEARHRLLG